MANRVRRAVKARLRSQREIRVVRHAGVEISPAAQRGRSQLHANSAPKARHQMSPPLAVVRHVSQGNFQTRWELYNVKTVSPDSGQILSVPHRTVVGGVSLARIS